MFKISRLFPWRTICSLHVRLNPSPVLVVQSSLSIARPVRVLWGVWTWNPRLNYVNFAVRSVFRLNWVESKFTAKYPSHVMKSADLHDSFDYLFKIVLIGDHPLVLHLIGLLRFATFNPGFGYATHPPKKGALQLGVPTAREWNSPARDRKTKPVCYLRILLTKAVA